MAYSDSGRTLASPWGTIERSGDPARDRRAVVEAVREVEAVDRGGRAARSSLSGAGGPAARAALDEAEALRALLEPLGVSVETADERLTHGGGGAVPAGGRAGRARRPRKVVDSAAAMVLLQAWLDRRGSSVSDAPGAAHRSGRRSSPAAPDRGRRRVDGRPRRARPTAGRAPGREPRAAPPRGAVGGGAVGRRRAGGRASSSAFVLWYELESHALGPAGPTGRRHGARGRVDGHGASPLSQHHVIGSSFAFRISDVFHGTPTVAPGQLRAAPEPDLRPRCARSSPPGRTSTRSTCRPASPSPRWRQQVDSLPGHTDGGFEKVAASGAVHSAFSPAGIGRSRGHARHRASTWSSPGRATRRSSRDMVQRFDRDAAAAGPEHGLGRRARVSRPTRWSPSASIVEKEGYIPVNMPDVARVIYNRLAQDMPLQMDSTVLYAAGPGRWTGDRRRTCRSSRPTTPTCNNGLTPDADLHAVGRPP